MSRIDDLLDQWEAAHDQGVALSVDELCRDDPELLDEVRRQVNALRAIEREFGSNRAEEIEAQSAATRDSLGSRSRELTFTTKLHVERFHAQGGLGKVYLATDDALHRRVAVKFPRQETLSRTAQLRFEREVRITSRLDHPGIIPVYAFQDANDGAPCYAMRFVEGVTLADKVREYHSLSDSDGESTSVALRPTLDAAAFGSAGFRALLQYLVTVCNIVAYAHQQGIIHRDIKPANILVGRFGEVLLVDWGLAKDLSEPHGCLEVNDVAAPSGLAEELSRTGFGVGTPAYASPEQIAGDAATVDASTDVFALGATLFALLAGRSPLAVRGSDRYWDELNRGIVPKVLDASPRVPRALAAICNRAMQVIPAKRYGGALELARDLECYLAGEPVSVWREPWSVRLSRWTRKHRGWTAAGVTILAGALVFGNATSYLLNETNQQLLATNQRLTTAERLSAEANSQARAALRTLLDDVVLIHLGRQAEITAEERTFLNEALARYEALARLQPEATHGHAIRAEGLLYSAKIELALGQLDSARAHLGAAIRQYTVLCQQSDQAIYRLQMAESLGLKAELSISDGSLTAAIEEAAQADRLLNDLHRSTPEIGARMDQLIATTQMTYGYAAQRRGDFETALRRYSSAQEYVSKILQNRPGDRRMLKLLAEANRRLMNTDEHRGDRASQIKHGMLAIEAYEKLIQEQPSIDEWTSLAWALYDQSYALESVDRIGEAMDQNGRAIEIFSRLAREYPSLAGRQSQLAVVLFRRCQLHRAQHDYQSALSDCRASIDMLRAFESKQAARGVALSAHEHHQLVRSLRMLGLLLAQTEQHEDALGAYDDAMIAVHSLQAKFPEFASSSDVVPLVATERADVLTRVQP